MDVDMVADAGNSLWSYVATSQKPTSIGQALKCSLGGSDGKQLVVSKGTRLEVYTMAAQGLQLLYDTPVFGRISALYPFKPKNRENDLLLLLTERFRLCVISWDPNKGTFVTESEGSVEERGAAYAENGQIAIADPLGQAVVLHLYQGMVQVIPVAAEVGPRPRTAFLPKEAPGSKGKRSANVKAGDLLDPFTVSIEELAVVNMALLHSPTSDPLLAVLHQDVRENRHLRTYYVSNKDKMLKNGPVVARNLDQGANLLIPMPAPYRGVLVVGEQMVTYTGDRNPNAVTANFDITIMTCWSPVDGNNERTSNGVIRFLLGDRYGKLYVLFVTVQGNDVTGMKIELQGETSAPSSLVYLDNGRVFVGSHFGDAQLIKLQAERNPEGHFLEVLERYTNLAPISDFAVMDLEKQGQGQIVACCGGFKDGSLRVVRNGVGINEIASFDMPGLKNVWSLRSSTDATNDALLVLSFVSGTQILEIEEGELGEVAVDGFDADEATLFCGNVVDDMFIQITAKGIVLVDAATRQFAHQWQPDGGNRITVARANQSQILCAEGTGRKLHYLEVRGREVVHVRTVEPANEVACLDMGDGVNGAAKFCAVGMWTTEHSVAVYGLPGLNLVTTQSLDGAFTPRSVAIASLEGVDHLLIGQGDGRLYDFTIEMGEGNFTLMDKRIVALGTQPITLTSYQVTGDQRHVFAGCDRPTVIYGSKKKLLYSQVNLKEVSNMCSFNSEDFPYSMAVISEEQLKIGTIDQIQKLHIKTIDLHEMARRIAHQEQSKTFGILTVKTTRDATTGDESESSYIKLLDDQTFEVLDSVRMNDHEMAISILSYQIPGVGEGSPSTNVYVVGTAFADPAEDEPSRGRLMAFEVSASASGNDKALRLLSQLEITGAAYCLAPLDGHVAAGVNNKVYVYRLDIGDDGNCSLVQVCGHHGMVVAVCMASRGPYLLVGDLMKSVSLLMWKSEQKALELVARDPDMNWMLATEMLDEEVFIGADNCFNLFTLRRNAGATKDEERKRLEPVGEFHLGGQVNKFQKGSLVMSLPENQLVATPNLLFAMSDGGIGSILNIDKETYGVLERLQTSIAQTVRHFGSLDHASWRSFANEKRLSPAHHFIDGDLIETFLDLSDDQQDDVVNGMEGGSQVTLAEVQKLVEELSRAH